MTHKVGSVGRPRRWPLATSAGRRRCVGWLAIVVLGACGNSTTSAKPGGSAPLGSSGATSTPTSTLALSPTSTTEPVAARAEGPSDGGWWIPTSWTAAGEEQGATDPLADGRYVGIVTLVSPDTISFDLVTSAPSESDRKAAVALGLLTADQAEIDGVLINRSPKKRVMTVTADAALRRLEPFGTANLVTVPRSDLALLVELSSRSGSAFHIDVRSGRVIAMDERYHP